MRPNRSVLRLATAQALAGANSTVVYATGAIIGHLLAPSPALATLPISVFVVGMALATLPVGAIARRHGRMTALMTGNVCGVLVGLLASAAIVIGSFALFCFAMLFGGAYQAVVMTFRFAATECVAPEARARALSTVLAGGIVAGVLGPELVNATMNRWPPHVYAVTYLASAAVAVLSAAVLRGVRFEFQPPAALRATGRSMAEIVQQPRFLVAILCGIVSYMMMNFIMTAAPLAMALCGISRLDSNRGIELHVIAMYAPSFVTGRLLVRFGPKPIVLVGLALTALSAVVAASGLTVGHFWLTLVLLGLGWNFGWLGASALVLTCHSPNEATRVQSINDFAVFGSMTVGSFLSGGLLSMFGWNTVAALILGPVAIAAAALLWLRASPAASAQRA
ncbi:MAG: MFS transporter [Proteobacteria bacterium]|nr:MFS transporter [Pseudomonadota bacterium]